ncbi:LrgB family protein [Metabacillus malikii]|uniref:Murein hydrolase (TIGR00659 family) n=1 Tax=Metabacillus malikii TaxID=1504265 RepID=A0ABT9ZD87_9BACI|nr:LrgB family protein [Metabacillus malikii]MDQ0229980.1 putative murein hydrolase (TIGR00659 family) [Metabacillus malikii]
MIFVFYTFVTYIIYKVVKLGYKKWSLPLFNPLLICPILIISLIQLFHIPADHYLNGSKAITHMLGPATVAFAIPIYKHFHLIKKYLGTIIVSITTGSLVAIVSTFILSVLFKLNPEFITSLLPRSITTPIAIEVSKEIGGLPTLTTIFVILTGVIGGILGPFEIKWFKVKSPIAKGLALGMSAHGVGTSKAMEYGDREGTFSTIAMIFAAWITMAWGSLLIPSLIHLVEI